jgi:hypothetical protein
VLGKTIKLKSTLDPKRTFKLKIKQFDVPSLLAWGDSMGTRVYTLTANSGADMTFSMVEKIGGPIFPFFASKIPSFNQNFEQFAADLKNAAENR